ncbi:polyprenyl synthetase family protein [Streptomyces sp. MI02-7b]|uniref:polyprenyl synthetase family protein n=1 Tax=Streptomyces sp. MI02-7b TaxID=462941 RepID=UPI0029AAB6DB|nr:polyprenyl synthetase family protein [Streptomyces sp. MI02-7b]MDX3075434.1 polyprenyl synthetase family protein [Streptomyces sp. MI02-7b]
MEPQSLPPSEAAAWVVDRQADAPSPEAGPHTDVVVRVEAELVACMAERRLVDLDVAPGGVAPADALTAFVLRGGSRLRARCVWWGWLAGGGPDAGEASRSPVGLAVALELLQASALVHDDVMDGSRTRRGGPALHVLFSTAHRRAGWCGDAAAYGTAQAVLAGDLALMWAEDVFRSVPLDVQVRRRADRTWRSMLAEMVAGQHLDLRLQAEGSECPEAALRTAELKTALYSVARPLELGAVAAGAADDVTRILHEYGRRIGLAFQLRDDLLGVYGDPTKTGKPSGDDIRSGKRTYLTAVALRLARKAASPEAENRIRTTLGDPLASGTALRAFRELLVQLGAVQAVEARISALADEAVALLGDEALAPESALPLERLARRVAKGTVT